MSANSVRTWRFSRRRRWSGACRAKSDVLHVPTEKRMILNFYKNNAIHFFLIPALVSRGLLAGLRETALLEEVSWWLGLYRWEFALPEREEIAAEIGRTTDYLREIGALTDAGVSPDHPFVACTAGSLDNFGEAYWITAQVIERLGAAGMPHKLLLDAIRKRYDAGLLLGEVHNPEGNSSVTVGNALNRYAELGLITIGRAARERDRVVTRGPRVEDLGGIEARLAASLRQP